MWIKRMMRKKAVSMAGKMMWEPELITASTRLIFLASIISIILSVIVRLKGKEEKSIWIGLWAPTLLLLGIYDRAYKMMKLFNRF